MAGKQPPAIGITCTSIRTEQVHNSLRYGQNQTYIQALVRASAAPLLIPQLVDETLLRVLYERLDGLLLPGGEDIDPVHFGEPVHEKCGLITPERDKTELTLTRWAVEEGKPLLAICRGIQVLNVALGGSLYQDIEAQVPGAIKHTPRPDSPRDRPAHVVTIAPDTQLARIVGTTSLEVNSSHHQAVKGVAPGLIATARAPDQIVEAVEAARHPFAIGVQWHPEDLASTDFRAQRLFDTLVEACRP